VDFFENYPILILKYPYSGWLSFSGIVAHFAWNMHSFTSVIKKYGYTYVYDVLYLLIVYLVEN